ncbi:MAG: 4-(cytidine 5'-diphospho)-2-C-methyl-D-erythritol kinase, partial [Planctomycetia bacterium]|nr:4-(cytidine 5'-diphospho)-2-C-methyl-D-erythritol kinase [Planctomycetia bacterium]
MKHITVSAPAKLNLFLAVGPRCTNGFHEVETVTVQLNLADQLELQIGHGITESSFSLTCKPDNLFPDPIPQDDRNLVVQALKRFAEVSCIDIATAIHLIKRIPSQAGLGGGSSDAAALLKACNRLWNLRLDSKKLAYIAELLGSDVPLFLGPTYSYCFGRGELVWPLFRTPTNNGPRL